MKLSKREIILMTLLLVIALIFAETKFILTPGIEKLADLQNQEQALDSEIQTIDLNLALAKNLEKKNEDNLVEINKLSEPMLDGVSPDTLLVYMHELLLKHGFTPVSYNPSSLSAGLLEPGQAEISQMTYRIKEIAQEYKNLQKQDSEEPQPTETDTGDAIQEDIVESFNMLIFASGSYDQIKALLDELDSLNRSIIIANIRISPSEATVDPTDLVIKPLAVELSINFYGIEKLVTTDDKLNQWTRETQPVSTEDPYYSIIETEPSEATTETTVG